jgi:DNA-binding MarR family transcriptional regulator
LSLSVKDTPEQTKAILYALARGNEPDPTVQFRRWQAFQKWLEVREVRVVVPFADRLAGLVPPVAVRLRRDFRLLLTLIEAHALLNRERRDRDAQGRILATLDDYAIVRELVADLFAEGLDATVKPETREVVAIVEALGKDEVSVTEIAKALSLDKSAVTRRISDAKGRGYLVNAETKRGRPARISLGDPLPAGIEILPHAQRLSDRCSVAALHEGFTTPSPSHDQQSAYIPPFTEVTIE